MTEMWVPQGIAWTDQWTETAVLLPSYKAGDREFLTKELGGHQYIDPHFYYEGHVIWGVTGRIVCEFLEIDAASG